MQALYSFILFSTIGQYLPNFIRYWAYDARYNAWAHHPQFGDVRLTRAHGCPNFDYAGFRRQRAMERDAIVLSLPAFKAKYHAMSQVEAA